MGLIRSLPVKARMRFTTIVEVEVTADRGAGLGDHVVGLPINFFVSPQALDEHIVVASNPCRPAAPTLAALVEFAGADDEKPNIQVFIWAAALFVWWF